MLSRRQLFGLFLFAASSLALVYVFVKPWLHAAAPPRESERRIGVFLQVGNPELWPDMLTCTANVVDAVAGSLAVDVRIAYSDASEPDPANKLLISTSVKELGATVSVYTETVKNVGEDVGQFLTQVARAEEEGQRYTYILKMHTKTNNEWRNLGLQSMCGTKDQVRAIMNNLLDRPELDLVVPLGTTFGIGTNTSDIAPVIREKYFTGIATVDEATFSEANVKSMKRLFEMLSPSVPYRHDSLKVVAGTMFWARYAALRPRELAKSYSTIMADLKPGYAEDGTMAHAFERFIPTVISSAGRALAHMPPAPKVFAIYFPQYHAFPENDRFWGKNFTEWTLLRPFKGKGIRKPLDEAKGGLGYYNLTSTDVRRRQGEMAKQHGVHGFMYYHYWFTGKNVRENKVMYKIPELMLADGEPAMPFFFSWANEPWTKRWNGLDGGNLLDQDYGAEDDWRAHFEYLVTFFKHKRYTKVDGKPMFAIYRPGHIGDLLTPMLNLWDQLAQEHGLPGLHIVNTVNNFYEAIPRGQGRDMDAAFHFLSTCPGLAGSPDPSLRDACREEGEAQVATSADVEGATEPVQYWGAFTGFNNAVRGGETDLQVAPSAFQEALLHSFNAMAQSPWRRVPDNYFVAAAWNEWNEQNVLEPDDKNGFAYLRALKIALQTYSAARI